MLPSQGYFKGIDCPFYDSNLCHRFYCHFRHTRRESNSSTLINNEADGSSVDNDLPQSVSVEVILNNKSCDFVKDKVTVDGKNQINSHKVYLPPDNIPSYNPTPISELKTRSKHVVCENVEHLRKCSYKCNNVKDTKSKESVDSYCSDLAKDLVNYFLESDTLFEIVSNKINEISKCSPKSNPDKSIITHKKPENFLCKQNFSNNTELKSFIQNEINLNVKNHNRPMLVREQVSLKENKFMPEIQPIVHSNLNRKQLDIQEMAIQKHELTSALIKDKNSEVSKTSITFKKKTNKDPSVEHKKKSRRKHYKTKMKESSIELKESNEGSRNQHSRHKRKYDNLSKVINPVKKEDVREESITILDSDSEMYDEFDEIYKNIQEINTLSQDAHHQEPKNDEKYDEFDEILKSIQELGNKSIQETPELESTKENSGKCNKVTEIPPVQEIAKYLPEPKKKMRISHVKTNDTILSNTKQNSYPQKLSQGQLENEFPQVKKKLRTAHAKAERNTITIKSTEDYISHWDRVKERVKNKFINPSGEEGYQNWSKVKISPVLNVSSLLNSKKLLYAKINQWNSGKK